MKDLNKLTPEERYDIVSYFLEGVEPNVLVDKIEAVLADRLAS